MNLTYKQAERADPISAEHRPSLVDVVMERLVQPGALRSLLEDQVLAPGKRGAVRFDRKSCTRFPVEELTASMQLAT